MPRRSTTKGITLGTKCSARKVAPWVPTAPTGDLKTLVVSQVVKAAYPANHAQYYKL